MDFNKLHTFFKVAEAGSITRASANLHLTQQAVSKQIIQLEEELQIQLFNRKNNQILLTKEGEHLYNKSKRSLDSIRDNVNEIQNNLETTEATIRIGCSFDYVRARLSLLIISFKKKYPNVKFKLTFEVDYEIEDLLLTNKLDLGLIIVYRDKKILRGFSIDYKQYILCASKSLIKKHGTPGKYRDLLKLPFAEYTENYGSFLTWIKQNSLNQLKDFSNRTPDIIVENDDSIKTFVEKGLCIGFIKKDDYLANKKNLVHLFPKTKPLDTRLEIVNKKSNYEGFIISEFKKHLSTNW